MQNRHRANKGQDPFPPRTRKIQQNRESIDLDDIMGGSDDDDDPPITPAKQAKQVGTPKRAGHHAVSAGTRDLMDFLAEGPPDTGGGRDMADFSADGPSGYNAGIVESGKPKGSGRLQRMISKLSLGNADKSRGASDDFQRQKLLQTPIRPTVNSQSSLTNLSSLANRPIPPRPPHPISPPSSPSRDSSDDQGHNGSRSRGQSIVQHEKRKSIDGRPSESSSASPLTPQRDHSLPSNRRPPLPVNENGHSSNRRVDDSPKIPSARSPHVPATNDILTVHPPVESPTPQARVQKPTAARKPAPVYVVAPSKPHVSGTDAHDMHRLMSKATTADECRLLYDMFLAKSGILIGPADYDIPYPSPSPSVISRAQITPADTALEHSLVELLLGGDSLPEQSPRRHRAKRKARQPDTVVADPLLRSSHGDRKTINEAHRTGNGEVHGNHRTLPAPPDEKEVVIGAPVYTQNHTPISEVGT
jgi:hypothetical protein